MMDAVNQQSETSIIEITNHAFEKGKERLNLKREPFTKMAMEAYQNGKTHAECKGRLKRYADTLWFRYKTCNNLRFYNQVIFFFIDHKLITVYQCPREFHNHLKLK